MLCIETSHELNGAEDVRQLELRDEEDAMQSDTAMLRFRHLLEPHELVSAILAEVNAMLGERGLLLREGTIVDATLIHVPSSTKNAKGTIQLTFPFDVEWPEAPPAYACAIVGRLDRAATLQSG